MLVPLVIGYVAGAVGFYSLLSKTAVSVEEDAIAFRQDRSDGSEAEVLELFPSQQEERKAA
jgi:hypothetical protein